MFFRLMTFGLMTTINAAIEVALNYEADCPFCEKYIVTQLAGEFAQTALQKGQITLKLLPYGNARSWNQCQHGIKECQHNMMEACVLQYFPETNENFPIIKCLETAFKGGIDNVAAMQKCVANTTKLSHVDACWGGGKGEEGKKLIEQIAAASDKNRQWVPWVLFDGQHNKINDLDLKRALCATDSTITGCDSVDSLAPLKEDIEPLEEVCLRDDDETGMESESEEDGVPDEVEEELKALEVQVLEGVQDKVAEAMEDEEPQTESEEDEVSEGTEDEVSEGKEDEVSEGKDDEPETESEEDEESGAVEVKVQEEEFSTVEDKEPETESEEDEASEGKEDDTLGTIQEEEPQTVEDDTLETVQEEEPEAVEDEESETESEEDEVPEKVQEEPTTVDDAEMQELIA